VKNIFQQMFKETENGFSLNMG